MADSEPPAPPSGPHTPARRGRKSRNVSTPVTSLPQAQLAEASPSTPKRTPLQKLEHILDAIRATPDYTIGDFLAGITQHDIEGTTVANKRAISSWLRGSTGVGTRPVEIVKRMWSHPAVRSPELLLDQPLRLNDLQIYLSAHDEEAASISRSSSRLFSTASTSANVPFLNAHAGISHWATKITMSAIDKESESLVDIKKGLGRGAGLTWDALRDFSVQNKVNSIQTLAPVLWTLLCVTASVQSNLNPSNAGSAYGDLMGVTLCVFLLMNFRNRLVNLLAAFFGVFLFACNAQKDTFRILNRLGVSSAHSTVHSRLQDLAKSAASTIADIGQNATVHPFLVVYDNINKYRPAWRQTVAKEAQLKSGTAATAIMMEDVPPDAFDLKKIETKKAEKGRSNLTVNVLLDDIDHAHLKRVAVGLVMRTAVNYVAGLSGLGVVLEQRFKQPSSDPENPGYAKDRLRTRASKIVPLGCSGISEASSSGNSDVLDDLFSTQLQIPPTVFKEIAFLVCGDQMTIDRLRKLMAYVEDTAFSQRRWVIPLIQLWHMKWAFLKAIYGTHYSDTSPGKHPHGLRAHLEAIRRKINAKKCDFYPSHSGLKTVFESLVLTALLKVVSERFPQRPDLTREPNPLELLVWFFGIEGPLYQCTIETLDSLAEEVYSRWMTSDAYANAIDPSTAPLSLNSNKNSDHVLANSILLMRDTAWYLEFCAAVAEGDIGRVLEIIKILRFYFWGSGSTNYGTEVLELACGFLFDFPDPLRQAIGHNWLVNPSGLEGHRHELDLLQEHHNLWIKRIYNSSNSDFDSKFLRELVSLNVTGFSWARKAVVSMLGLKPTSSGNPDTDFSADIAVLAQMMLSEKSLSHVNSRSAEVGDVSDNLALGVDCLNVGQLQTFITWSLANEWDTEEQLNEGETVGALGEGTGIDEEEILPDPLTMAGGRMGIAEFELLGGLGNL